MRRTFGTKLLVAALLLLLCGVATQADDQATERSPRLAAGCVHDLFAIDGAGGLRVRFTRADGLPTKWVRVEDAAVGAVLRAAFLDGRKVTVIRGKNAAGKPIIKGAWLSASSCACKPLSGRSTEQDSSGQGAASAQAGEERSLRSGCVWPTGIGEARRPSQLLEEIKTWARADHTEGLITAAKLGTIVAAANAVESPPAGQDCAAWNDPANQNKWPWPYLQLRAAWGKASLLRERRRVDDPPINPPVNVVQEWTEIQVALMQVTNLGTAVPAGLEIQTAYTPCVWPHGSYTFESPESLLQSIVELGTRAHEAQPQPRLDEDEYVRLLTAVGRCLDPDLRRTLPSPMQVCGLSWSWPYRHLVGIWGKAVHAEMAGSSAEWDEVLNAIDAFPDEIEDPHRNR